MKNPIYTSLYILIFLCTFHTIAVAQDTDCNFPPDHLQQIQNDEDPYECADCGGCTDIPENPSWDDMLNEASGMGSNDIVIGGTTVGDIQNDYDPGDPNSPYADYPMDADHLVAWGNMINTNSDLAALVDCININCFSVTSVFDNPVDLAQFDDFISNMDVNGMMASMDPADFPPGFQYNGEDYNGFFDQNNFSEVVNQQMLQDAMEDIDINALAEIFFGQQTSPETPCGGGSSFRDRNGQSDLYRNSVNYQSAEMDLFSSQIKGLEKIGDDQLVPSPAAMNTIKQIKSSVDLYNGVLNTGADLYTLQSNDLSVPVSLNYTGTGVKLNDYSSDVGTNWNLNAGGQITRIVNALPDEYRGTALGSGMGLINVLKPCVKIPGTGVSFVAPPSLVHWSPLRPTELTFKVVVGGGVIPIPFFPIPFYIYIDVVTEINVRAKPGRVQYEEEGLGYQFLTDASAMSGFGLDALDLQSFTGLSADDKEKYFNKITGKKALDDYKFLSPVFDQILSFWDGINNLFGDEVKKLKKIDTEPDRFYFNFGGYSGQFVINQNGKVYTIPHTELKIEEQYAYFEGQNHLMSFKVATPEGAVYHFGSTNGHGVELSQQINYTLPNTFTYPENGTSRQYFNKAMIDEASLPFSGLIMCWPRATMYGSTYEKNYTIMHSPKYTSTWHLTKVESLMSGEEIALAYEKVPKLNYYSNKSLTHVFPNFDAGSNPGDGTLQTQDNNGLNPIHPFATEWQNGKASLTYSASENLLDKYRIKTITGQRGEVLHFHYEEIKADIPNDRLVSEIELRINGQFSKSWVLKYDKDLYDQGISCSEDDPTTPVYQAPEEWVIQLGQKYEKHHWPKLEFFRLSFGISQLFETVTIPYPQPLVPKNLDHHRTMSEFGSLVEIKGYENILDIDSEKAKFEAEASRAFLFKVFEKDRNGSLHDFMELEYDGEITSLPKRFSLNQDLWGYWNKNESSLSLLPRITYRSVLDNDQHIDTHADLASHFSFNNPLAAEGMYAGHNEAGDEARARVGSLLKLTFETGAKYSFQYALNDWPLEDGTIMPGAGLRVSKLIEDPNGSPIKETEYVYDLPTVVNRPIRITSHEFDKNDYDIERYVRVSTQPMNMWLQNKSNYVGYGKVIERFAGNGYVVHQFTTPEDDPAISPPIRRASYFMAALGLINSSSDAPYATYGEPFPDLIDKTWRYGLPVKQSFYNESDQLVQKIQNAYEFVDVRRMYKDDEAQKPRVLKAHLFQRNFPGTWLQNQLIGGIINYIPWQSGAIGDIISILQSGAQFIHPFRKIYKEYFYSLYQIESEQIWVSNSITEVFYPDGTSSLASSSYQYNQYQTGDDPAFYRMHTSSTSFNNGQSATQKLYYVNNISALDARTDQATLDGLKDIGIAGYGAPVRTEDYLNGALTSGFIGAFKKLGSGQFVSHANWSVHNGSFKLDGKFEAWHSSGLPGAFYRAEYGVGTSVNDYEFFPPLELNWSGQLQLTSKKIIDFQQGYTYNALKELITHTDENQIVSDYQYDARGRLSKSIVLNGRKTNAYSYSYNPNVFEQETSFSDGTPTQMITSEYNGLGMLQKVLRQDGAVLESKAYDNFYRVIAASTLGRGTTLTTYDPSPVDRMLSNTDAMGNTTTFSYSGHGAAHPLSFTKITTVDPNGSSTESIEDAFSKVVQITSGIGGVTHFAYDGQNRLSTITNPIGELYEYQYNDMDKVIHKKVPGASAEKMWYDERYRLAVTKDGNDNHFFLKYDDFGRIVEVHHAESGGGFPANGIVSSTQIQGNFNNLVLSNQFQTDKTWLKQRKEKIFGGGGGLKTTSNVSIDDIGQVTFAVLNYPEGGILVNNAYNAAGLVTSTEKQISALGNSYTVSHQFKFDDQLRLEEDWLTGNGIGTTLLSRLQYDAEDRLLAKLLGGSSGTFLQEVNYSYDAAGKLLTINSLGENECLNDTGICTFEATVSAPFEATKDQPCAQAVNLQVDGQIVTFSPVVNLSGNGESLAMAIENALDELGLIGEVEVSTEIGELGIIHTVTISNSNANQIILGKNGDCDVVFDPVDCCQIDQTEPGDPPGNDLAGGDLFYESITYDALNISRIEMYNGCNTGLIRNVYSYDDNHRVTQQINKVFNDAYPDDPYSTSYEYDPVGNITSLQRNGLISVDNDGFNFGPIDQLSYAYTGSVLQSVSDAVADPLAQPKGFVPQSSGFSYDANGNLISDSGKGLAISYNPVDLPLNITGDEGSVDFSYTFLQEKIKKVVAGDTTYTKHYFDKFEIADGQMEGYYFSGGRVVFEEGAPSLEFQIEDHLGNVVVRFADKDQDGLISTDPADEEVLERHLFYPFGLKLDIPKSTTAEGVNNHHQFSSKELNKDLGLNWLDFDARWYDPAMGRWTAVDPLASDMPDWSPYNYGFNNPIANIDPNGLSPISIIVKQAAKYGLKKAAKKIVKEQIEKRLQSYMSNKWAKQLLDDALTSIDHATKTAWWEWAVEAVPWVGDAYGAGKFTKQQIQVWATVERFERRADAIKDNVKRASSKLDSKLGGSPGDKLDAHHLIPVKLLKESDVVQDAVSAGFDFNGAVNGILVKQYHGPHHQYTSAISSKIEKWKDANQDYTPDQAKKFLEGLAKQAKSAVSRNTDNVNSAASRL